MSKHLSCRKKIIDLQTEVHNSHEISQDVYSDIEQEVLQIIKCYQKIEEKLHC